MLSVVGLVCRKLYWADQGTESGIPAKVASADMDGGNPAVLFTNNLDHVEFLTVDIRENKLYWAVTGTGMVSSDPLRYPEHSLGPQHHHHD